MKILLTALGTLLMTSAAFAPTEAARPATDAPAVDKPDDSGITPAIQKKLDEAKVELARFAADPRIVKAVQAQNEAGPISGMTNAKWKKVRRRDDMVKALQSNTAAKAMAEYQKASGGIISEAFLNATKGEKVAFLEKTSSYIHKGKSKFDVPFDTLKAWQGTREFDESSQTYQVQISVPVLVKANESDKNPTKPIGVIVVGVNLEKL